MVVVALLLAGAAIAGVLIYRVPQDAATSPRPPDVRWFYGQVVDQDGKPIQQAEIKVVVSELGENTIMVGSNAPIIATQRTFSVWTNQWGTFAVQVPSSYQQLTIEDVVKPGYEWVFDWAWGSLPYDEPEWRRTNRIFHFAGNRNVGTPYNPDLQRPAVFPMHEVGSNAPATRPSRGGSDGRFNHEPVEPIIPSAGPDAPKSDEEVNERIRELPPWEVLRERLRPSRP